MKKQPLQERFLDKVELIPFHSCWEWNGYRNYQGYGTIRHKGKSLMAHRVSLELRGIKIPEKMFVCHKCDNPGCVNPDHLFIGSCLDNAIDRDKKGRGRGGPNAPSPIQKSCKRGHEFNKDNTYLRPGDKARVCLICKKNRAKSVSFRN